jgi:hypothetical protein
MMKRITAFFVVLSAMIISAQPVWAAPGQDPWREAKLKEGQGITHLLKANACSLDHLFPVMDRNGISVSKLRKLLPGRLVLIPRAEQCAAPADPKDAKASREILIADGIRKAEREAANRNLLAMNVRVQELETRLAEKTQALEKLKDERERPRLSAAPVPVVVKSVPARGYSGWMLAFTLVFGLIVGGGGVRLFSENPVRHGFVSYKAAAEVELLDGTRHVFPYAGASPLAGSDVPSPHYKCPYCGKRDLRDREGAGDPHIEFRDHMRSAHFSLRVRVLRSA